MHANLSRPVRFGALLPEMLIYHALLLGLVDQLQRTQILGIGPAVRSVEPVAAAPQLRRKPALRVRVHAAEVPEGGLDSGAGAGGRRRRIGAPGALEEGVEVGQQVGPLEHQRAVEARARAQRQLAQHQEVVGHLEDLERGHALEVARRQRQEGVQEGLGRLEAAEQQVRADARVLPGRVVRVVDVDVQDDFVDVRGCVVMEEHEICCARKSAERRSSRA